MADIFEDVRYSSEADIRYFIQRELNGNANFTNNDGITVLHFAVLYTGNAKVVKVLNDMGADVNARADGGVTPLHVAADAEIAKVLINSGADINSKTDDGRTPLYLAITKERNDVALALIDMGADVNICDANDLSPLDGAIVFGDIEIIEACLSHGADVNAKDKNGFTPLHKVVISRDTPNEKMIKIIKLLISKGADKSARSNVNEKGESYTPLDFAVNDAEVSKVLMEFGESEEKKYNRLVKEMKIASTSMQFQNLAVQFKRMNNYEDSGNLANKCAYIAMELLYNKLVQEKNNATTVDEYLSLANSFREIKGVKNSNELANECEQTAIKLKYNGLVEEKNTAATEEDYKYLSEQFKEMKGYKNSNELANECNKQYITLKERREAEEKKEQEERERQEAEKREQEQIKNEKIKKKNIITAIICIGVILILVGIGLYNSQKKTLTIPDNVTIIKEKQYLRKHLVSVEIPESVTTIEKEAFRRNKLTSIYIPDSVTEIGLSAFANNPIRRVRIGANVILVGNGNIDILGDSKGFNSAYRNNGMAAGLYICTDTKNGVWESWHDNYKFKNDKGNITIICYTGDDVELEIPAQISGYPVTHIAREAFTPFMNHSTGRATQVPLRKRYISVSIPNSVITIGINAFYGNELTNIIIPNSVTSIGIGAFFDNNLTSIVIPNSVTSIEYAAFGENPITSIRIGANVKLGENSDLGILGKNTGFNTAYTNNGRRAGTYTRPDTKSTTWTRR